MPDPILDVRICGIPAQVRVDAHAKGGGYGNAHLFTSDRDYYGYCEFTVLDRNGREAPWLERKINDSERQRIESEIADELSRRRRHSWNW